MDMLCCTVRVGSNASRFRSSGTNPTPAAWARHGVSSLTGLPATVTSPVADIAPPSASPISALPEPTSPAMPTISPRWTSKVAPVSVPPGAESRETERSTSPFGTFRLW